METETLIQALSNDLRPVRRHAVARAIAPGLLSGTLVTIVLIIILLGIRPDLDVASRGSVFWVKWTYTSALGVCALLLIGQLARPDTRRLRGSWLAAVPVGMLAVTTALEFASVPPSSWASLWLGYSWQRCPWLVFALAVPIFVGLLWSLRHLAPTRSHAAGAAAGLAAGAFAASLYGLHCTEASAAFVMTWYSLGIALATGGGALAGPHALRW